MSTKIGVPQGSILNPYKIMQITQHFYQPLINYNRSTVINNNINQESRHIHNLMLVQRLSLNVSKNKIYDVSHAIKMVLL